MWVFRWFLDLRPLPRTLIAVTTILALGLVYLAFSPGGQRADKSFDISMQHPNYATSHPVISFDQGHNNAHELSGSYRPFAKLARADGYEVRVHKGPFTPDALKATNVLMIVNADGGTNPKLFGFNLVPLRKGVRGSAAFTDDEVRAIHDWVSAGGSLFLVTDLKQSRFVRKRSARSRRTRQRVAHKPSHSIMAVVVSWFSAKQP